MTDKQLTSLGREWQRRLRLQDWDVTYTFVPNKIIHADAQTIYNASLKCAKISVTTEVTREGACQDIQPYDAEQALVHELLHLHWEHLPPEHQGSNPSEVAIDLTAWALVQAKRGEK